jgi:hypothetical protein
MPTKFCSELRDRAVRMVYDRHALESGPGAQSTRAVAPELGVGEEPLRGCPWPWQSPHWWPREVPAGGQVEVPTLCSCRP